MYVNRMFVIFLQQSKLQTKTIRFTENPKNILIRQN